MISRQTEWFIRITGTGLLAFALYKLYSRPLTHSYHEAFLFNHLQIVLFVMILLVLALVAVSFEKKRWRGLVFGISFCLLAPYPFIHHTYTQRAEQYFFEQRYDLLQSLNRSILEEKDSEESIYYYLDAYQLKAYEKGQNYIAYQVDRMPEQRDGFVYLLEGELPDRLFQFPLRRLQPLGAGWYAFSAG
ncbi:MAG: hypothetical protein ACLFUB_18080 [Cyclobacteriaceae bacterium]